MDAFSRHAYPLPLKSACYQLEPQNVRQFLGGRQAKVALARQELCQHHLGHVRFFGQLANTLTAARDGFFQRIAEYRGNRIRFDRGKFSLNLSANLLVARALFRGHLSRAVCALEGSSSHFISSSFLASPLARVLQKP
jgi:hypothetical protein